MSTTTTRFGRRYVGTFAPSHHEAMLERLSAISPHGLTFTNDDGTVDVYVDRDSAVAHALTLYGEWERQRADACLTGDMADSDDDAVALLRAMARTLGHLV